MIELEISDVEVTGRFPCCYATVTVKKKGAMMGVTLRTQGFTQKQAELAARTWAKEFFI